MNLIINKNCRLEPFNAVVSKHEMPCGKHARNIHEFDIWSKPDASVQEMHDLIRAVVPLSEGEHTITYELTGVTHKIKASQAPRVINRSPESVSIALAFIEIN